MFSVTGRQKEEEKSLPKLSTGTTYYLFKHLSKLDVWEVYLTLTGFKEFQWEQ